MANDLTGYFRDGSGGDSIRTMADKLGMVHTTLADQLRKANPPAQTIVALCRVYGLPMAPAFIAAGIVTEEEALTFSSTLALRNATDLELAREMVRRVEDGTTHEVLETPLDENHPAMKHLATNED